MSRSYNSKNQGGGMKPDDKKSSKYVPQKQDANGNKFVHMQGKLSIALLERDFAKIPKDQIQKILDAGINTHEYRTIVAHQALEALRKDPKWKGENVMDSKINPKGLHEMQKLAVASASRGENEFAFAYDQYGRFLGITFGGKNSVLMPITNGMSLNGHYYHTHPSNDSNGRLGHSFSYGDIWNAREFGMRSMNAFAKEGTYRIEAQKTGWSKVSESKLNSLMSKLKKADTRATKIAREAWAYVKDPKDLPKIKEYVAYYNRLYHYEAEKVYSAWSSKNGLKYTFTPNAGYETLTNLNDVRKPLP